MANHYQHNQKPNLKLIPGLNRKRIDWFDAITFALALASFLKAFHII